MPAHINSAILINMIEFYRGQGSQQPACPESQHMIENMLLTCPLSDSFIGSLNYKFNNYHHFGSYDAPGNMQGFLYDLHDAFISNIETLQVLGDVHSGAEHYSGLIGQYGQDNIFYPARVLDKYISVRLKQNTHGYKPYANLYPDIVYHLLVDTPYVTFTEYDDTHLVML